jgi:hypothetical protein
MEDFHEMLSDEVIADTALVTRLEETRSALADALFERDLLECRVCPELEASYQNKVGSHEFALFEAQSRLTQVKRRVQLVKNALASGTTPNLPRIERQIRGEMSDQLSQLDERRKFLKLMQDATTTPDDEERELERLFRICLERLHPDLHPRYPDRARNLYLYARNDFTKGDLEMVKAHVIFSREPFSFNLKRYSPEDATDLLALWEMQIEFTRDDVEEIKANHPYSERGFLDDEELVRSAVDNLDELTREYNEECGWYEMECRALLGN